MFAALFLLATLQTDTVRVKPPAEFRFTGDIGYVATAGNSSVETLNFGNKFSAKLDDFVLSQTFALVYGESEGKAVTSLYRGSLRMDQGARTALITAFVLMNFERNTFSGLASRWSGVSGLTVHLLAEGDNQLRIEGGLSLTRQRGTATKGRDVDFLGGRAAGTYIHKFSPRASVSQVVEVLPNFREPEDLRINTESALVAPLTSRIAVKLSYVIRYDGLPEESYQSTDRLFTSGLQVSL